MSQLNIFKGKSYKIAELLNDGKTPVEVQKLTKSTSTEVYRIYSSAVFQDWQRAEALAELGGIGARAAIRTLLEVAQNKKASSQSRVSAADKLLQYTGLQLDSEGNIDKNPSNMTASELQQRLQDLQKESGDRAKNVNIIEGEVSDTLDDLF